MNPDNECDDCGPFSEHYYGPILKDELWLHISDYKKQLLCSQCVEKRLGRPIEIDDVEPFGLTIEWWFVNREDDVGLAQWDFSNLSLECIAYSKLLLKVIKEDYNENVDGPGSNLVSEAFVRRAWRASQTQTQLCKKTQDGQES